MNIKLIFEGYDNSEIVNPQALVKKRNKTVLIRSILKINQAYGSGGHKDMSSVLADQ
jgi:hypothetical protein